MNVTRHERDRPPGTTALRTDDLIRSLTEDAPVRSRYGRAILLAALVGTAIAIATFASEIGVRRDVASAAETTRFLLKFVITILLGIAAFGVATRIGKPGVPLRDWSLALLAAPLLLASAVGVELFVMPQAQWATLMVGKNALFCLSYIPLLSIGPLVCLLLAMRQGAPGRPALAGAAAGLGAAAIAATLYAAHCTDDSPLFVATWYTLAIAMVVGIGAIAGSRVLRW